LAQMFNHGCSIVAAGAPALFDARRTELEALILSARIEHADIVALCQVWDGLPVIDRVEEAPAQSSSAAPGPSVDEVEKIKCLDSVAIERRDEQVEHRVAAVAESAAQSPAQPQRCTVAEVHVLELADQLLGDIGCERALLSEPA